jgi:capsular exopolysaccharide synthesis family protein
MLMLSRPDNPRQVFLVTSPLPGEGKSFTALQLALVLAENSASVLLVDADLRRGTLSRTIGMSSSSGLSTMFARESTDLPYRSVEWAPGLTFLPAGATPPNPAGSLGSARMSSLIDSWRKSFEYVVIDSPPVLPVTDAVALSPAVDGVVAVVRFAVSSKASIKHAIRLLTNVNSECFGVVVNGMDMRSAEYGYYGSAYGYGADHDDANSSSSAGATGGENHGA